VNLLGKQIGNSAGDDESTDRAERAARKSVAYPILQAKPSTHCICAYDHLFYTHGHKVFTDKQIL
jgi:hypothetical protein